MLLKRKLFKRLDFWLWYSIRRRLLDRDLKYAENEMTGDVLEIGCGRADRRGLFIPPTHQTSTWITTDLEERPKPHVRSDMEALPFKAQTFDTIVCLEVLEYVCSPQKAMREIARLLREEGRLILSVPFMHRADTNHDLWRFSDHGLRRLLHETDLRCIQSFSQGGAMGVVVNILKYAVFSFPAKWTRRIVALTLWPLLQGLVKLDQPLSRRLPVLQTFSTGYMIIAEREPTYE